MDIIATVGPSLLTNGKIDALVSAGVTILRINGAHAAPQEAASLIERLRRSAGERARIMVDLPTNKVRVTNLSAPILFEPGATFVLDSAQLNYPALCKLVRAGDEVIINNGIDRLRVTRVNPDSIEFQTKFACRLDNNRGLIFVRDIHTPGFPFFFQRDLELIEVINDLNVDLVGLSYLRYESDKEAALQRITNPHSLVNKQGRLRASPANFVPAARKPPKPRTLGSAPVGAGLPEPTEKRALLGDRGARRSASGT